MKLIYVLGIAVDTSKSKTVVLVKNQPAFLKGLFNGLGGKVDAGESLTEAMAREFKEECDVSTNPEQWIQSAIYEEEDYIVNVFYCIDDKVLNAVTMESEVVSVRDVNDMFKETTVSPNYHTWLELALSEVKTILYIKEPI